jgi:hypothetical protein
MEIINVKKTLVLQIIILLMDFVVKVVPPKLSILMEYHVQKQLKLLIAFNTINYKNALNVNPHLFPIHLEIFVVLKILIS